MEFDVTIEIPKGQRNKYEMDHNTGRIRLDRTLFTSTQYPYDYGFVEATLGQDIKNSTADAKKSEVVSDAEAQQIIAFIQSNLEPAIQRAMAAIKTKKTELAAAGLGDTVLGDLKDLRVSSNALGEALVEKAPATQHEAARSAMGKVDAAFEDAIKFFSTA